MAKKEIAEDIANKVLELNEEAKIKERMGLFTRLHIIAGVISAIWIFYATQYLVTSGWWSNRFAMSPPEFVGFISGMVLPLVLIWLMVAYIDRSRQFQKDSQTLQKYMEQLVSPTEDGAAYTKALTDTLRVYVKEFKEVFQDVSDSSGTIASDLKDRISELKTVQKDINENTKTTVGELTDQAQNIIEAARLATENSKDTAEGLKWQIENLNMASEQSNTVAHNLGSAIQDYVEKFKLVSDSLSDQTDSIAQELNNRTEMLNKASDHSKNILTDFSVSLADQISEIEDTTERVKSRTDNLGIIVDEKTSRLEQVFQKQEQGLQTLSDKIDEKSEIINETLKSQSEIFDAEIDKITTRSRMLEDGLSLQTTELVNASDTVIENITSMYEKFDMYKENLVSATTEVTGKIQDVGDVYIKATETLANTTSDISGNITSLSQSLEDKFHSYTALADGYGERLTTITVTAGKEIDELRSTINDINDVVVNVKEDITKQSENLSDLTNMLDSQGKMAEASLVQQQRTLSATGVKIEEIKNELKHQVDEFELFYEKLDIQAHNYLKRTKESAAQAQADVDNLVKHTIAANESIDAELGKINETNSYTLTTSEKVSSELTKHAKVVSEIMQMMQNKTNDIYKLFTSQKTVIESSAKEIQAKVGKISSDFENNMTLLMKNAHETTAEVSDISKELQSRAEEIDSLFIRQDEMLSTSAQQLNENATKVLGVIRTNTAQLDSDLDRIRSRISLIEDSLSSQVKELIGASEESLGKVSALSEELGKQSTNVATISKLSQDSLNDMVMALIQQSSKLVNVIEDVENQASVSGGNIEGSTKGLHEMMSIINNSAQGIVVNVDEHISVLEKGAIKAQNQAQLIRNLLGKQMEELVDTSNIVTTNTRLSEAAIAAQCKNLTLTASTTVVKIKEVSSVLKQNTADVLGNVTRVNKELEYVGDNVKIKSEEAYKTVQETINNTHEIASGLEGQFKSLEDVSQKAILSISSVVGQLKNNALSIEGASDSSLEQIQAVSDALDGQKHQLDRVTEEATKTVRIFAGAIKDRETEFNETANGVERRIAGFIESIRELAKEFEDISNDSVAKVDVTSSHLRSTITEVSTNSNRIATNVKDATTDFVKQSEALNNSAGEAIAKLENLLIAMRENSSEVEEVNDKLSANALKVGGALSRHVQALISASDTAEEQVKKLDKKSLDVSHDNFLKEASFIIEKLQAVAVDITRIFQPNVEEELWKKYYNGDRAAFMRYLIKALDKHQVSSIRKLFEHDNDFRDYVAGYMSNFEAILDRAKLSDRSDVIIAILTGSDVGRLYMILARALSNKE